MVLRHFDRNYNLHSYESGEEQYRALWIRCAESLPLGLFAVSDTSERLVPNDGQHGWFVGRFPFSFAVMNRMEALRRSASDAVNLNECLTTHPSPFDAPLTLYVQIHGH